jgi:outer membrane biosynthesis protein TonB
MITDDELVLVAEKAPETKEVAVPVAKRKKAAKPKAKPAPKAKTKAKAKPAPKSVAAVKPKAKPAPKAKTKAKAKPAPKSVAAVKPKDMGSLIRSRSRQRSGVVAQGMTRVDGMAQVTLTFPRNQFDRMRGFATRANISMSEAVRQLIALGFKKA